MVITINVHDWHNDELDILQERSDLVLLAVVRQQVVGKILDYENVEDID